MKTTRVHVLVVAALVSMVVGPAHAAGSDIPPPDQTGGVDLRDPQVIAHGLETLRTTCGGYCHGTEGSGFKAPRLRGRPDLEPEGLFATISFGRKRAGKVMPPWKGVLPDQDIWSAIAAILSLRDAPVDATQSSPQH